MQFIDSFKELQITLKQIMSTLNAKYDGKYIQKGKKSFNVHLLRSKEFATNYNPKNQTLYVSPSDVKYYSKLKEYVQRMWYKWDF